MEVYKIVLLAVLTAQTASYVLLAKYVFQRPGVQIHSMALVLFVEFGKLILSLTSYLHEVKSLGKWMDGIRTKVLERKSFLNVAGLSMLYVLQNNAAYIALRNMGAARFQVTYQIKILVTAILCVVLLKKAVTRGQWVSVALLTVGVALLQLDGTQAHQSLSNSKQTLSVNQKPANALVGLTSLILAALCSSFAGVYNEKLLKESPFSIWIVNIQLYVTGTAISLAAIAFVDRPILDVHVLFRGVDLPVLSLISLSSAGGLIVSLVLKHAGNILKSFAVGLSIIISAISSSLLFMESFGIPGIAGMALVAVAIPLYAIFRLSPPDESSVEHQGNVLALPNGTQPRSIGVLGTHAVIANY